MCVGVCVDVGVGVWHHKELLLTQHSVLSHRLCGNWSRERKRNIDVSHLWEVDRIDLHFITKSTGELNLACDGPFQMCGLFPLALLHWKNSNNTEECSCEKYCVQGVLKLLSACSYFFFFNMIDAINIA